MTRDPVCGIKVDIREARQRFSYMGKIYYFCTRACREAFPINPDLYLAKNPWT